VICFLSSQEINSSLMLPELNQLFTNQFDLDVLQNPLMQVKINPHLLALKYMLV